jgi:EmrB/QacA subfamily drug resistance transporter
MSPPATARARTAWTLILTSAATFMAALDNLVVTTALPAIREDLSGGLSDLEWIVNGYTLPFACLLLLGAALGDRFGRRTIFTGGIVLFTVASAMAAMATSTGSLIAARAAQGAGAAALLPLSLTLVSAVVPAARRGMAFGIWGAVNGLAVASGPLIGGTITEHISWHWIFWLNVPVGIALVPLVLTRLADSRGPNDRLDLVGTAMASAGMFAIVLAIVRGNEHGWTSSLVLTGFIAGSLLLVAFVWWELRAPAPMLPMRFFRSPAFTTINVAGFLMFLGVFGSIFLLTQFLQFIQGYNPQQAGLRMLPWTAMPMVVAPITGALSDRFGGRPFVISGLLTMAVGLGWFALIAEPDVSYLSQVPALALCGVGMAMFFAPASAILMGSVAPAEQGIASGVNNALREVGGAVGVALLASVFVAQGGYQTPQAFTDGLVPALWVGMASLVAAAVAMLWRARGRRPSEVVALPAEPDKVLV